MSSNKYKYFYKKWDELKNKMKMNEWKCFVTRIYEYMELCILKKSKYNIVVETKLLLLSHKYLYKFENIH